MGFQNSFFRLWTTVLGLWTTSFSAQYFFSTQGLSAHHHGLNCDAVVHTTKSETGNPLLYIVYNKVPMTKKQTDFGRSHFVGVKPCCAHRGRWVFRHPYFHPRVRVDFFCSNRKIYSYTCQKNQTCVFFQKMMHSTTLLQLPGAKNIVMWNYEKRLI